MGSNFLRSGQYEEFTDFYICGHSFGGYITGNYALKYHRHIRKVLLLSPIGIRVKAPGEPDLDPMKRFEGQREGPPRWSARIGRFVWNKKFSPLAATRFFGKSACR